MQEGHSVPIPIEEISDEPCRFDFIGRGDSPLLLKSRIARVLVFGIREESFGHEMIRFVPLENGERLPSEDKSDLFYAYADFGLLFSKKGRFVSFVSPISGAGVISPSERQFGIMYPIIALDLLDEQFAFLQVDSQPGSVRASQYELIEKADFHWYPGWNHSNVIAKFRELNPRGGRAIDTH